MRRMYRRGFEMDPGHRRLRRLRFAAFAPSFPKAVRVFFGKCATVRLLFATLAAFFTLRRAAVLCLELAIACPLLRQSETTIRKSETQTVIRRLRLIILRSIALTCRQYNSPQVRLCGVHSRIVGARKVVRQRGGGFQSVLLREFAKESWTEW
jgi:hypothetical protein